MVRCVQYCTRIDFPLRRISKTFRHIEPDLDKGIKKCKQCIYVTITQERNCPCCGRQFSGRKKKLHHTFKLRL
jgi:hypothetical protein